MALAFSTGTTHIWNMARNHRPRRVSPKNTGSSAKAISDVFEQLGLKTDAQRNYYLRFSMPYVAVTAEEEASYSVATVDLESN